MDQILSIVFSDAGIMIIRCLFLLVVFLQVAPIMAWVERRGSALMQNRLGPNRIGPLGLLQSAADGLKFVFKEDPVPGHVNRFYYILAPLVSMVPAVMTFSVVPIAAPLHIGSRVIEFQVANLNVGVLYTFAIASLGVYGIIMAGWASNNKYALLGSLRSSSQMISYELSMSLSVVSVIMVYSVVTLNDMAVYQSQTLAQLGPIAIPMWGIFIQPLSCLIFLVAIFAETNRLPFDLPEGESEIVAGYHLEYGSMKFALFQMAEYGNMFTGSALFIFLYLGGWHAPGGDALLAMTGLTGQNLDIARVLMQAGTFFIKAAAMMWFFVWVRWTLPRFRYDQLMDLGWKLMLPLALANIFATGAWMYWMQTR